MAADPMISIVLPVFNEAEALAECLRVVIAALEAIGRPFEIVAVDDGSSDRSGELLDAAAGKIRVSSSST